MTTETTTTAAAPTIDMIEAHVCLSAARRVFAKRGGPASTGELLSAIGAWIDAPSDALLSSVCEARDVNAGDAGRGGAALIADEAANYLLYGQNSAAAALRYAKAALATHAGGDFGAAYDSTAAGEASAKEQESQDADRSREAATEAANIATELLALFPTDLRVHLCSPRYLLIADGQTTWFARVEEVFALLPELEATEDRGARYSVLCDETESLDDSVVDEVTLAAAREWAETEVSGYRCASDEYDAGGGVYSDVEEFCEMVDQSFGIEFDEADVLDKVDSSGNPILVPVYESVTCF